MNVQKLKKLQVTLMIKLKVSYSTNKEKDKLLALVKSGFKFKKEPKEYKKEGPHKYIRLDLLNK